MAGFTARGRRLVRFPSSGRWSLGRVTLPADGAATERVRSWAFRGGMQKGPGIFLAPSAARLPFASEWCHSGCRLQRSGSISEACPVRSGEMPALPKQDASSMPGDTLSRTPCHLLPPTSCHLLPATYSLLPTPQRLVIRRPVIDPVPDDVRCRGGEERSARGHPVTAGRDGVDDLLVQVAGRRA